MVVRSIGKHVPGVRTPSEHELGKQVKPEKAVFVHDPPDGSASVQSPVVFALGSGSEVSQFAAHNPGLRTPSRHVVAVQLPVFVQDPPEGNAIEQSPTVFALVSSSDASQVAKKMEVRDV